MLILTFGGVIDGRNPSKKRYKTYVNSGIHYLLTEFHGFVCHQRSYRIVSHQHSTFNSACEHQHLLFSASSTWNKKKLHHFLVASRASLENATLRFCTSWRWRQPKSDPLPCHFRSPPVTPSQHLLPHGDAALHHL